MSGFPRSSHPRFARFAWIVLAYTLLVILWGAFVRSSISGDGCGVNWPLCDGGSLLPHVPGWEKVSLADLIGKATDPSAYAGQIGEVRAELLRKLVEFSHRLTSGILLPLVLVMLFWSRRAFEKGHAVRRAAGVALFFVLVEAFIGAVLVRQGWVTDDSSLGRVIMAPLHLLNTFILIGAITLCAWYASGKAPLQLRGQGPLGFLAFFGLGLTFWLSVTGALSALGGMVYKFSSHAEVLAAAAAKNAPLLIAAKPQHPYTACVVAMILSLVAGLLMHLRPSSDTRRWAYAVWFLLTAQMMCGLLTIWLMAPPFMQLAHLLLADLLWLSLVLLCVSALAQGIPHVEMLHVPQAVLDGERARLKDYVALTKPRVISLLLFTTLTAMFIAAQGWPGDGFLHGLWMLVAVGAGLYAAAGSSNTINMVLERDLDVRMERTATRPTVTERIHPRSALWFAFGLEAFSFGILWWSSNLLAATLALAGLVVYVVIYTLLLKRRTWSNIVIGGAAGCFPAVVGYAAVAEKLSPLAWVLFALIFVWTPVHFWALAILIKDDYAKAGVPMLPVVKGDKYTVDQILLYAIITVVVSFAPLFWGMGAGLVYGVCAIFLNALLLRGCAMLYYKIDRSTASGLFHYSMLYLALLFLALAIDKTGTWRESLVVFALLFAFLFWKFPAFRGGKKPPTTLSIG